MNNNKDQVGLYPQWREALKIFLSQNHQQGEIVPKEWFYRNFGIEEPDRSMPYFEGQKLQLQFMSAFESFRQSLLVDHRIDLQNVYARGYKIVPANMQAELAHAEGIQSAVLCLAKALQRVTYLNKSELTTAQRRKANDLAADIGGRIQIMKKRDLSKIFDRKNKLLA